MPFDPDDGAGSPALDAIVRGPAAALTAVALVAGDAVRRSGWSARAAVQVARLWPRARGVVLVDLDIDRPSLHDIAGVANDEGIADIIEFGASLHRVALDVPGASFAVLPAGAAWGDGAALLESREWTRVLREASGHHDTLLLYVPVEAAGAASIIQLAGAMIVFAEAEEASSVVESLARPFAVLTVLTPVPQPAVAATGDAVSDSAAIARAAPLPDAEFERIRLPTEPVARQELIADLRERQRAARMAPGTAASRDVAEPVQADVAVPASGGEAMREARVEAAADDVALETIVPTSPAAQTPRRYAHPLWWSVTITLIASLIGGAYHYLRIRPDPTEGTQAAPEPQAPLPPPVAIVPTAGAVEYAVALEAHQNLATAFGRIDALSAAQPDLTFFIAPLERNGTLYYHVMAGPVTDSSAAVAVRDTLVARRVKTAAAPTDVRHSPLALLIGDYSARDDAAAQIEELRRLDIPSYIVVGVAADDQPLYRVFVGGFSGPAEADVVRQLLRAAGIRDTLVNRSRSITP